MLHCLRNGLIGPGSLLTHMTSCGPFLEPEHGRILLCIAADVAHLGVALSPFQDCV